MELLLIVSLRRAQQPRDRVYRVKPKLERNDQMRAQVNPISWVTHGEMLGLSATHIKLVVAWLV